MSKHEELYYAELRLKRMTDQYLLACHTLKDFKYCSTGIELSKRMSDLSKEIEEMRLPESKKDSKSSFTYEADPFIAPCLSSYPNIKIGGGKIESFGSTMPESKKCEEKCCDWRSAGLEPRCDSCKRGFYCIVDICPCKCHLPLTETHTVEPEENGIPESTPYLIDKRYLDELIEEMKPECDCICHGPIAGDKSCAVSCKHCVEPDYYTREEIDEKMKKIIKIMDGRETIASGCNEIVYVDKADEKAFRAEILSALRGIITDTIPKKAIPAWHGAIESLKSKFL